MEEPKDPYTQEQMIDAMEYIRSYIEYNGGDPYDFPSGKRWQTKPKNLPEDVSAAYDTYKGYWNMIREKGIIV